MTLRNALILAAFALVPSAFGQALTFEYKDPKEISAVSLTLDSLLEPITGFAKGISGTISFDPEKPLATTGKVAVAVSSIIFANEGYTATARGYALNETKYPELTLEIKKVISCKKVNKTTYKGKVLAEFVCRGVAKEKTLEVTASYLPGRAEERTNGNFKGDLLILRTTFDVSRKAHGISEGIPDDLVGDTIEVRVAVVGIHYWPKGATK